MTRRELECEMHEVYRYDPDHRRVTMARCGHTWAVARLSNPPPVGSWLPCPVCVAQTTPVEIHERGRSARELIYDAGLVPVDDDPIKETSYGSE